MKFIDLIKDGLVAFFDNRFTRRKQFSGDPNLLDEAYYIQQKDMPSVISKNIITCSYLPTEDLFTKLDSNINGLTADIVLKKQAKFGLNQIEEHKKLTWYKHLWLCYKNPFNLLLTVLDVFYLIAHDIRGIIVLSSMIVISTVLRFVQEIRSNNAADKLKEMVSTRATVLRIEEDESNDAAIHERHVSARLYHSGVNKVELPIKELVPGDIVMLSAGDLIPADVRILSAKAPKIVCLPVANTTALAVPLTTLVPINPIFSNSNGSFTSILLCPANFSTGNDSPVSDA